MLDGCCDCVDLVDGVDPNAGGASGNNADGLYYNFAFTSSGNPYFVPFKTLVTQGANDGRVNFKIIQSGTVTIDFRIVTTAAGGNTTVALYVAGILETTSGVQVISAGQPGNLFSFPGIVVAQDDSIAFEIALTTNLGEGIGFALVNYTA